MRGGKGSYKNARIYNNIYADYFSDEGQAFMHAHPQNSRLMQVVALMDFGRGYTYDEVLDALEWAYNNSEPIEQHLAKAILGQDYFR
jgi:hypothetical protein